MMKKTLIGITISFLLVWGLSGKIFLGNTPRINPTFIANLYNTPRFIASLPFILLNKISNINIGKENLAKKKLEDPAFQELVKKIPLQETVKGVRAGYDEVNHITSIEIDGDKIIYKTYKTTLSDGRVVTMYIPEPR